MRLARFLLLATAFVQSSIQQDGNTSTTYPGTTYPQAVSPNPAAAVDSTFSPPYYPSPWGSGAGDWASAYAKAKAFVSQLTLIEKVNLTTGVGSVLYASQKDHGRILIRRQMARRALRRSEWSYTSTRIPKHVHARLSCWRERQYVSRLLGNQSWPG